MSLRLRFVADINPSSPAFDRLPDTAEVPFLPLEAVWPGGKFDASRRRAKVDVASGYTRFQEGDILVPKITPTFEADRTVIARGIEGGVGAATTEVHVVRVSPLADVGYVRYLLSTKSFLKCGEAEMIGVAGQKRVPDAWLCDLVVPVREYRTQRAIASFLDAETARIDALIAKKRRMIELLEERFRSQRAALILGGIDPVTGAGEKPSDWTVAALGVVISLHRGFDLPAEVREEGSIPVVSSGGVSGWHSVAACNGPGVVTGRYGTIGEVYFVDGPYWPLNTTLFVSEFRGNDPRWVYYLLSEMPLDSDSAKSAVTGINRNVVGALRAPRPPIETQRTISVRLDGLSNQLVKVVEPLQRQIDLLIEHRQALITAAVTGELEVPGVAV